MRNLLSLALGISLALFTLAARADVPESDRPLNQPPEGFTALFNGKDLSGWHGMPTFDSRKLEAMPDDKRQEQLNKWNDEVKQHWRVEDGILINDGKGAYLTTDKDYRDIELLVDYRMDPKGDSGVYLKGTPQVQIWDYTEEGGKWKLGADKGSGGLWNNSPGKKGKDPLVLADKPFGEWNHFRIIQAGATTSVYLNDKLVVDHAIMENYFDRDNPLPPSGPIQLQTHGAEIRWRNVFVKELSPKEASAYLSEHDKGFETIFNGKDLDGWKGATDSYQVVDGAILCKPHKGGVLYYDKNLKDFAARVEFKLPPGGNNGLAIRYPGEGDTAYSGMCELQVLDNSADRYTKLDPRQYHGSAYGMAAAKRGYLRPVGQWNFQEVRVRGHKVTVILNGTVILKADLSTVSEFHNKREHSGRNRTEGFFGFAGHNEPVQFRDIQIKELHKHPAK